MRDVCLTLAKEFYKSNRKLCVLVSAVDRTCVFLSVFAPPSPSPTPPPPHPLSVGSCGHLLAALGPVGVHVPLETRRGEVGGGRQRFSNFCIGVPSVCIFELQTLSSGPWGLAELRVLPFGKPEFYRSLKQFEINSFDTANS